MFLSSVRNQAQNLIPDPEQHVCIQKNKQWNYQKKYENKHKNSILHRSQEWEKIHHSRNNDNKGRNVKSEEVKEKIKESKPEDWKKNRKKKGSQIAPLLMIFTCTEAPLEPYNIFINKAWYCLHYQSPKSVYACSHCPPLES